MLPKKNRADTKTVESVFKSGNFLNSPNLSFKFIKNNLAFSKISFVVPKSVAKKAVERNLLKRRGYLVLKKYFSKLPVNISAVFIFKKPLSEVELEEEIKIILKKL